MGWRQHSTLVSNGYLLPYAVAPGLIPSIHEFFSEEKVVNVAEIKQWRCLKESGQWLENVDRTHIVLASVKLVPQKGLLNVAECICPAFGT